MKKGIFRVSFLLGNLGHLVIRQLIYCVSVFSLHGDWIKGMLSAVYLDREREVYGCFYRLCPSLSLHTRSFYPVCNIPGDTYKVLV